MQEIEDPVIKLFGKKIPLCGADASCEMKWMEEEEEEEEGEAGDDDGETEQRISIHAQSQTRVPSVDRGGGAEKSETSKMVKESSETSDSRGKTLKKPDKILPCPRCDSMDTKFCYYNNYNVKQPRHFCRACQRHWTAGGSMRNMPVGAGRRKSKRVAGYYRHFMISGALSGEKVDVLDSLKLPDFKSEVAVPGFGADIGKLGDECSSTSSITISNSADNGSKKFSLREQKALNLNGSHSQIPCLPGFPWPYPWNLPAPSQALYPASGFWTWNIPLVSSHQPSLTNAQKNSVTSTDSTIPGKRSREPEPEIKSPKQGNACLVVPKSLRIDDPREAAKSSIWTSLGIAHDSNANGSLSSAVKQNGVEKVRADQKLPALQANPAALSRSLNFLENN